MRDLAYYSPHTGDTTLDGSVSSLVTCNEAADKEIRRSRLARSLKNYQSKSAEEVSAILQKLEEIEDDYDKKAAEFQPSIPEVFRLRHTIFSNQAFYGRTMNITPSIDLDQMSAEQLRSFHQALECEMKAGEATWALYEIYGKMQASFNALEKSISFREEHFVLRESEQRHLDLGKRATILCQENARETARILTSCRQMLLERSDRND